MTNSKEYKTASEAIKPMVKTSENHSIQQAYGEGLLAGICRKLEISNPYSKKQGQKQFSDAWLSGYKAGKRTVIYHTNALRLRPALSE